ncbi:YfhO family protein [Candidatus Saganbacteria bacterium]|uniref:YfhO family protein n=1 Tax=Candidatus Saganbacteria bacterium TaxID=2575572 RepID=A0A9D6UK36_UNCSA|nr:YfhO family protein [Candidatus Saganbacteria bacterium]
MGRSAGSLLFALFLAAGLTAVQLIPFLEVVFHSVRSAKPDFGFIAFKAFPPRELLNFILPFFFGNPVLGTYDRGLLGDSFQTWLLSPYIGILPLIFAFLSLRELDRRIVFFWVLIPCSLFLAFGRFTPVYGWFFHVFPGAASIRYPVKFIFPAIFSLAVLAGFGLENLKTMLAERDEKTEKLLLFWGMGIVILAVFYIGGRKSAAQIFYCLRGFYPAGLQSYHADLLRALVRDGLLSLNNLVLTLGLGLAVVYFARREVFSGKITVIILLGVVLVDLATANGGINPPGDGRIFAVTPPNLRFLRLDKEQFRYYAAPGSGKENTLARLTFNQSLYNQKDNLALNWLVTYHIKSVLGRESVEPREISKLPTQQLLGSPEVSWLGAAAVKYILSDEKMAGLALLRDKEVAAVHTYLYRNPEVFPRAYIRDSLERREIQSGSQCEIVKDGAAEVVIHAKLSRAGFLFLSDTFYPGWKVFVDGKEDKIQRAEKLFRAVRLEAGSRAVKFVYAPFSFKIGGMISAVTLLGIMVMLILPRVPAGSGIPPVNSDKNRKKKPFV